MREHGLYRITIALLIIVILTVAIGLGWVSVNKPGLVFYVGALVLGLLVWFDFRRGRARRRAEDRREADQTTLPGYHDSVTDG